MKEEASEDWPHEGFGESNIFLSMSVLLFSTWRAMRTRPPMAMMVLMMSCLCMSWPCLSPSEAASLLQEGCRQEGSLFSCVCASHFVSLTLSASASPLSASSCMPFGFFFNRISVGSSSAGKLRNLTERRFTVCPLLWMVGCLSSL